MFRPPRPIVASFSGRAFVSKGARISFPSSEFAVDQANLAAGSDSVAVQQQAQDSSDDAVVAGARAGEALGGG